jgi:hypothetical protein
MTRRASLRDDDRSDGIVAISLLEVPIEEAKARDEECVHQSKI